MINRLNLSSEPFRNRTMPWLLSSGILLVSVLVFIFLYAQWSDVRSQTDIVRTSSSQIEEELKIYQAKEDQVRQQLSPEQKRLLIAAHKLVIQKQFSWSRLFSDLENVLPGGVSVASINVDDVERRNGRTEAILDFAVLSRNYQTVVGMIDTMNSSGIFRAELRGQDLQKSESGDYTKYTIHLVYSPHYNVQSEPQENGTQTAEVMQ